MTAGDVTLRVGDRVQVTSLRNRAELNGKQGVVQSGISASGRISVLLDGNASPFALKPINLRLISRAKSGSIFMPRFEELCRKFPQLAAQLQLVRPYVAGIDSSLAMVRQQLPSNVSLGMFIGALLVTAIICVYTIGFFRAALVFSALFAFVRLGGGSFVSNGGGRAGIAASVQEVAEKLKRRIFSITGFTLSNRQTIAAVGFAFLLLFWLMGPSAASAGAATMHANANRQTQTNPIDSSFADPIDDKPKSFRDAYLAGWNDKAQDAEKFSNFKGFPETCSEAEGYSSFKSFGSPPMPPPTRSSSVMGSSSGFSLLQMLPLALVGYNIFNLGKTANGWSPAVAIANAKNLPTGRKVLLGFLVLRVLGLSPI